MKKRILGKKILAVLITASMVLSVVPETAMSVYAQEVVTESETQPQQSDEETAPEKNEEDNPGESQPETPVGEKPNEDVKEEVPGMENPGDEVPGVETPSDENAEDTVPSNENDSEGEQETSPSTEDGQTSDDNEANEDDSAEAEDISEDLKIDDTKEVEEDVLSAEKEIDSQLILNYKESDNLRNMDITIDTNEDPNAEDYMDVSIPASYKTANLPRLRNQNPYGTCWAHASISQADIYCLNHGISLTDYSELHLSYFGYNSVADCLGGTADDHSSYTGSGLLNLGGNMETAGLTMAGWIGAADENVAVYAGSQTSKINAGTARLSDSIAYTDSRHLQNMYVIDIKNNPQDVKKMIMENGSVGITYYAVGAEDGVARGSYSKANNAYYESSITGCNHAVTVVGWDDNFSKSKFATTPPGNGAWLIRNSWYSAASSSDYYYNSIYCYFWMSYYDTSIQPSAISMTYEAADNYDNNYQYDGNPICATASWDSFANVFTASAGEYGEKLKAFSFYSGAAQTTYTASVYKGLTSDKDPTQGTLVSSQTGALTYAGYHTIKLNTIVPLSKGDKYSIVVTLRKADDTKVPFGIEYSYNYSVNDSDSVGTVTYQSGARSGQSYVLSGRTWVDYGESCNRNVRLKAFTDNNDSDYADVIPTNIVFDDATLTTNGKTMNSGETFSVGCHVEPQDASDKTLSWSSSNTTVATVDSTGKIEAKKIGTTVITVKTVTGNVTATFVVTVAGVNITTARDTLYFGEQFTFIAQKRGVAENIVWSSQDPDILSITPNGVATVVEVGDTVVTASAGSVTDSYTVHCLPNQPASYSGVLNSDGYAVISWEAVPEATKYTLRANNGVTVYTIYPGQSLSITDTAKNYTSEIGAGSYKNYILKIFRNSACTTLTIRVDLKYQYPIYYHMGVGTNNANNPTGFTWGKLISIYEPTAPTGYVFVDWYKDEAYTIRAPRSASYLTETELHFYAKFRAISYTLILQPNNGTDPTQNHSLDYDETFVLPTPSERENYQFVGWNTMSNGSGTNYEAGDVVNKLRTTDGATITLYGQWRKIGSQTNSYKLTYMLNGGTQGANAVSRYAEGDSFALPVPTKSGYVFGGWYLTSDFKGAKFDSVSPSWVGDKVLFAKWGQGECVITLANMEGAISPYGANEITYIPNKKAFTLKKPAKTGYSFSGWYKDPLFMQKITKVAKNTSGNFTIYAKWTANKYKVKFSGNKSTGGKMKVMTCYYDADYSLYENVFSKKGYEFVCWNSNKYGTGTDYTDMESIRNLTIKKNGTVTLYAKWKIVPYTIEYYDADGTLLSSSENPYNVTDYCVITPTFKLYAPQIEKDGMIFDGWYKSTEYLKKEKVTKVKKGTAGNMTLYAKWKPIIGF